MALVEIPGFPQETAAYWIAIAARLAVEKSKEHDARHGAEYVSGVTQSLKELDETMQRHRL